MSSGRSSFERRRGAEWRNSSVGVSSSLTLNYSKQQDRSDLIELEVFILFTRARLRDVVMGENERFRSNRSTEKAFCIQTWATHITWTSGWSFQMMSSFCRGCPPFHFKQALTHKLKENLTMEAGLMKRIPFHLLNQPWVPIGASLK